MSEAKGTGPGRQTKDGCSVELYRLLPHYGEVDRFGHLLAPAQSILELGCGAGRLTRELLARGHPVTVVDNSEEMLASVAPGAKKVLADIEHLRLRRTFDAVLLASCLVNTADAGLRRRMLETCREHLEEDGLLIFERHDPAWLRGAVEGPAGETSVAFFIDRIDRDGNDVEMTLRYRHGTAEWTHSFSATALDDADIDRLLDEAGFAPPRWLDEQRRWGVAAIRS